MADFMTENKSFIVYKDWEQYVGLLSDCEAGKLLKALFGYAKRGEEPEFDGMLKMAFAFMKAAVKRDGEKWEEVTEKRRAGGSKGGRPPKDIFLDETSRFSAKASEPDKETDKEKDKVKDTDKEKDKDKEKDNAHSEPQKAFGRHKNVFLSDTEYESLVCRSSADITDRYIEKLSDWLFRKGKSCFGCFGVISGWIDEDGKNRPADEEKSSYDLDEFMRYASEFTLSDHIRTVQNNGQITS